jgi:hypothetical protein
MPAKQSNRPSSHHASVVRSKDLSPATQPKRVLEMQRYIKKQRFERQRQELSERFLFTPEPHPDVEDFSRDAKRILKTLELDDVPFLLSSDLFGLVDVMMICAGHPLSEEMPADIKFLYALQRVHDYHHGRVIPAKEEWARICKILVVASFVRETLRVIDEERKAGWPLRAAPRSHRRKAVA